MDGYEAFCEQRGQGPGNELMREFVACAKTRIRNGDWFARASCASVWIVLPETAAKGAQCAAKQYLKLFELQPWAGLGRSIDVSVSISVTALDSKHDDRSAVRVASMLREADRCKTVDRRSGQDRVQTESSTGIAGSDHRAGAGRGLN
jgi:GGDEF domain-containing protein